MISVAIVGATGLVGEEIIKILEEEGLLSRISLTLFVSEKSAGKTINILGKSYPLYQLTEKPENDKFNVVFFSAGDDVSKSFVKMFADRGAVVIDNSNAFRREEGVPLVVPEINFPEALPASRIIANPNCSTIELAVVVHQLLKCGPINKIVVSTYQSVSGAGKDALADYVFRTKNAFPVQINENLIPFIGNIDKNGFCSEENKIEFELKKILSLSADVFATTIRVPIPYCHGESVYVQFGAEVDFHSLERGLLCAFVDYENNKNFYPTDIAHTNKTAVCRLKKFSKNEIGFFVIADNLRRGAAYNAVLIFKELITKNLINP